MHRSWATLEAHPHFLSAASLPRPASEGQALSHGLDDRSAKVDTTSATSAVMTQPTCVVFEYEKLHATLHPRAGLPEGLSDSEIGLRLAWEGIDHRSGRGPNEVRTPRPMVYPRPYSPVWGCRASFIGELYVQKLSLGIYSYIYGHISPDMSYLYRLPVFMCGLIFGLDRPRGSCYEPRSP